MSQSARRSMSNCSFVSTPLCQYLEAEMLQHFSQIFDNCQCRFFPFAVHGVIQELLVQLHRIHRYLGQQIQG